MNLNIEAALFEHFGLLAGQIDGPCDGAASRLLDREIEQGRAANARYWTCVYLSQGGRGPQALKTSHEGELVTTERGRDQAISGDFSAQRSVDGYRIQARLESFPGLRRCGHRK